MRTIRVKHAGLTPAGIVSALGFPLSGVTRPEPETYQDITMEDSVNLPLIWPCIRDYPPGYIWVGEFINGELVETPEPQIT